MYRNIYNTLPNLIIIGAPKAGTTSLFNWLAQHPEIYGDEALKDFNFFIDDFYYKELGIDWFRKQFKPKNEKIIMHGYVNYMYYFYKSIDRLYQYKITYRPDLKLIAVLRNPIDRAYSAFWDAKKVAVERAISFEEVVSRELKFFEKKDFYTHNKYSYLRQGLYSEFIKSFIDVFGRENLNILIFEKLITNPYKHVKDIFCWLGVNSKFSPNITRKNEAGMYRYFVLQKLIRELKLPKFLKKIIPLYVRRNIKWKILREWNVKKIDIPPMEMKTKETLLELYKEEVLKLEELLNEPLMEIWNFK